MTQRFYLVPIETVGNYRGPEYFAWRFSQTPAPELTGVLWHLMDYGFLPTGLVLADVDLAQQTFLAGLADVYSFPENLDTAVTDPTIDTFFETLNIPTDWLTPSTTYRELLRNTAGMFQFNQRYGGTSGGHSVFETATLDTRLRQMTAEEQAWFLATAESFGFDPVSINTNSQLRLLVRQAATYWEGQTFVMGGIEF